MPSKYKPTEANTDSRANRIVKNALLLAPGVALSIHEPSLKSLSDSLLLNGSLAFAGTAAVNWWINGHGRTLA